MIWIILLTLVIIALVTLAIQRHKQVQKWADKGVWILPGEWPIVGHLYNLFFVPRRWEFLDTVSELKIL